MVFLQSRSTKQLRSSHFIMSLLCLVFNCILKCFHALNFVLVFVFFKFFSYLLVQPLQFYSLWSPRVKNNAYIQLKTSSALPYFWDHSCTHNDTNKYKEILRHFCSRLKRNLHESISRVYIFLVRRCKTFHVCQLVCIKGESLSLP